MIGHLDTKLIKDEKKRDSLTAYLLGIVFFLLTLILKLVLDPYLQFRGVPYLLAFFAIVVTASYGGILPGILTTLLSAIASNLIFTESGLTELKSFLDQTNALRTLTFILEGSLMSFLVGRVRNMQKKAVKTSEISIKNEQYLRGVLDSLFVFVGVLSKDGVLLETNRISVEQAGLDFDDVIGKDITDSYWWSFSDVSKQKIQESINDANRGKITRCDTNMRIRDGKLINVDYSIAPLKNEHEDIEYLVILAVDVDQRTETLNENKKLYRELKKQKKITDNIIANIPGVVWELGKRSDDEEYRLNFVSDYVEVVLGYKIGICKDDPNFWQKIIHEDDRKRVLREIDQVYRKQKSRISQFRCVSSNGKIIWMDARFTANTDDEGNSIGVEGVLTDITDRIKLEQTKDEFVSIASHEIKTPLTTIKAFTQIIDKKLKKDGSNTELNTYLGKMNTYITRLNQIINDFLDFSKIESGKLEYYLEEIKISDLLTEVVSDMQSITETHKIILKNETEEKILGDKNRIAQVLINLINNAIKYSPNATQVIVESINEGDKIIISVSDFGIGIPIDSQKKIFEKFFRVSNPKKRSIEGFGLGLYISSEIIKRHGGKIWLKSEVDKGSTFYISLPKIK